MARGSACVRLTGAVASCIALCGPCMADDGGLFDEPALDVVLYRAGSEADRAYRFPDDDRSLRDVLTQHNDNNRSGVSHWPGINQDSVRKFRKLGEISVLSPDDPDAVVAAQPLYAGSALVNDVLQPVLIVATSTNRVFAFTPSETASQPLWSVKLGDPLLAQADPSDGAACDTRPNAAYAGPPPGSHKGYTGIEGTPVIDLANNQVLVGFKTNDGKQHLASVELNHHVVRTVDVPVPGGGDVRAWGKLHRNRASLLLADGVVYLAFSSLCEGTPDVMHGSLVAFDARTLAHVGTFMVTEGEMDGGGIWQAANGPAADTAGNVYVVTGNRRLQGNCIPKFPDVGAPNVPLDAWSLSNSVVRLKVEKRTAGGDPPRGSEPYTLRMSVQGYFTPYRKILGDCRDLDLASSGPLLIPGTPFIVSGGKEGILYVLDRFQMGGYDKAGPPWDFASINSTFSEYILVPQVYGPPRYVSAPVPFGRIPADDRKRDHVWQKFPAGFNRYDPDFDTTEVMKWPHIHGTPAFARFDRQHAYLFVWPEKDALKRFRWIEEFSRFDDQPAEGDVWAPPFVDPGHNGMPGGMVSVNIDPTGPQLGVVFASVKVCHKSVDPRCDDTQNFGILRAYDPFTMEQLWCNEDDQYWYAKFVAPTVAADRVFLPTTSGKVLVYGVSKGIFGNLALPHDCST